MRVPRAIGGRHRRWHRADDQKKSKPLNGRAKPVARLKNAQIMAAHESPRTAKLYDRTGDEITLDEVERIAI
jgi:hypothetical protein